MLTTAPKTLFFPGVHGQTAYCHYQIALSKDIVRPKVYILINHEDSYTGTFVVNNEFSCDHVVNKILSQDLTGIRLSDVKVFYRCISSFEPLQIHHIPVKLKWRPKLSLLDKIRIKAGEALTFYPDREMEICGNCPIETDVNTPASKEDKSIVERIFNLKTSPLSMEKMQEVEANE